MKYYKVTSNNYIEAVGDIWNGIEISKQECDLLISMLFDRPTSPDGYTYKLRADNLEWELVELPPLEPEPLTDEEALTRYANELTGADDPDLISAAETLIEQRIKEDS